MLQAPARSKTSAAIDSRFPPVVLFRPGRQFRGEEQPNLAERS